MVIDLDRLGFRENVEVLDIPRTKVGSFCDLAQKTGARHYERKAQTRVFEMEKLLRMSCQRQLGDQTTRRGTVYSPSCSNSQKAVAVPLEKSSGITPVPVACQQAASTNTRLFAKYPPSARNLGFFSAASPTAFWPEGCYATTAQVDCQDVCSEMLVARCL